MREVYFFHVKSIWEASLVTFTKPLVTRILLTFHSTNPRVRILSSCFKMAAEDPDIMLAF